MIQVCAACLPLQHADPTSHKSGQQVGFRYAGLAARRRCYEKRPCFKRTSARWTRCAAKADRQLQKKPQQTRKVHLQLLTLSVGPTCFEGCVGHAVIWDRTMSPCYVVAQYSVLIEHVVRHSRHLNRFAVCPEPVDSVADCEGRRDACRQPLDESRLRSKDVNLPATAARCPLVMGVAIKFSVVHQRQVTFRNTAQKALCF